MEQPNGVLLVAKPDLTDPNFQETVVLVTQTPNAQTVGVILNRPTERKLSGEPLFFGGPVLRETIVALFQSREQPKSPAFHVLRDVYLTMQPETRYARSGDLNIAYQVTGDGPRDLVYVPGWVSNIEMMWEEPAMVHFLERLAILASSDRGRAPRHRRGRCARQLRLLAGAIWRRADCNRLDR